VNANTQATDYKKVIKQVKAGEPINIEMANGGGWAARFKKQ
jgi:alpha-glucosidase